jgi:hypothetical protein
LVIFSLFYQVVTWLLLKKLFDKIYFELREDPNPLGVDMLEILNAIIKQDEVLKVIFEILTLGKVQYHSSNH